MQKIKLTIEVSLAEVMAQIANAVENRDETDSQFGIDVPLYTASKAATPKPRKVHVVGSRRKGGRPLNGGQDRTMLMNAIQTVLREANTPLLPRTVRARILEDDRFKVLLKGERPGLVASLMFFYGHQAAGSPLQRVADGYIVREQFSEAGVPV